jgi:UDP-N-acetylmuramyl pentapeptide synthase
MVVVVQAGVTPVGVAGVKGKTSTILLITLEKVDGHRVPEVAFLL